MTDPISLLSDRLHRAGIADIVSIEPATGGLAATSGLALRSDGSAIFAKAFADPPSDDAFTAEAEGLAALRNLGGVVTPDVLSTGRDLLVLSVLRARPDSETFWEQCAHALARLHTSTTSSRF